MKRNQFFIFLAIYSISIFAVSCSSAAQQSNTAAVITKANENSPVITSSHGASQTTTAHGNTNNSTASGSSKPPMMTGNAQPIDTSEYDAEISNAEKQFKAKPKDEKAKIAVADAYAKRAFALTEAAQYRSALGDFRKSLKLDPSNEEARAMHDRIVSIFNSMGREVPKEGEEPAPLPFKKGE